MSFDEFGAVMSDDHGVNAEGFDLSEAWDMLKEMTGVLEVGDDEVMLDPDMQRLMEQYNSHLYLPSEHHLDDQRMRVKEIKEKLGQLK